MNSFFKSAERCFWIVVFSAVTLASSLCYAHDWQVHMATMWWFIRQSPLMLQSLPSRTHPVNRK